MRASVILKCLDDLMLWYWLGLTRLMRNFDRTIIQRSIPHGYYRVESALGRNFTLTPVSIAMK